MSGHRWFLVLTIACLSLFWGGQLAHAAAASPRRVTVHYVATTGQTLKPDRIFTGTGILAAYGTTYAPAGVTPTTKHGYVRKILGYVPVKLATDRAYQRAPKSLTVTYVKASLLDKRVEKAYLQQINAYRQSQNLPALQSLASLQRQTKVRSKELLQGLTHVRPDGTSYNTKNSGYAEVMAYLPKYFLPAGTYDGGLGANLVYNPRTKKIDYQATAATASNELLTCDQLHRQTELNTWAHYSAVSFHFMNTGAATMAQLFKL